MAGEELTNERDFLEEAHSARLLGRAPDVEDPLRGLKLLRRLLRAGRCEEAAMAATIALAARTRRGGPVVGCIFAGPSIDLLDVMLTKDPELAALYASSVTKIHA
jgi:hypothetical protein